MSGLTGIQPLSGLWVNPQPEATAEQRQGGSADPRHAQATWAQPERMPWALQAWALSPTVASVDPQIPATAPPALPAGTGGPDTPYYDATPDTHAGPWIRGIRQSIGPDESCARAAESAAAHADGLDNDKDWLTIAALQDSWTEQWNPGQASPNLQQPVGAQVRIAAGGFGSTDAVGNPDGRNGYDFGNAHLHRRYATGSIPGNYMWMRPGGRPMVKSVPGPARPPVGEGPFQGQSVSRSWGVQGAVLMAPAGEYVAPADPRLGPDQSQLVQPGPVSLW